MVLGVAAVAAAAGADVAAVAVAPDAGAAGAAGSAFVDEAGRLFLASEIGLGIVHSLDMEAAADAIERGAWTTRDDRFAALVGRFAYQLEPKAETTSPR